MESKDKLKETDIKNCTCFYFDDILRVIDIDFIIFYQMKNQIKSFENILACDFSYKAFMSKKPVRIRFDKIDKYIKIYAGIRY